MGRSLRTARRAMSMTSYSLHLGLLLFIMAKVSGLLLFPWEIGHAAFGVPRERWIPWCGKCRSARVLRYVLRLSFPILAPFYSLTTVQTRPYEAGRGMRINCFLQVQRAATSGLLHGVPTESPYAGGNLLLFSRHFGLGVLVCTVHWKRTCCASPLQQNRRQNSKITQTARSNLTIDVYEQNCIEFVWNIWPFVPNYDFIITPFTADTRLGIEGWITRK